MTHALRLSRNPAGALDAAICLARDGRGTVEASGAVEAGGAEALLFLTDAGMLFAFVGGWVKGSLAVKACGETCNEEFRVDVHHVVARNAIKAVASISAAMNAV